MTADGDGAGSQEPRRSILDFLETRGGRKARVALRQDDSAPVLKPVEGRTQAGKYQLQGEIARGGVGVVLKGHDTDLGRDVALKVIREEYRDNPEVVHRFVEEAQIGGQLQHPGIVPVYDLGVQDGRPYFSMKLVKGRTLAKLLEDRAENRRGLLSVFEAVCQTMAYAHTRGVIHRDLKPANVMVGAFGEVHVVDWGMGKVLKLGGVEDERRAIRAQTTVVATVRSEPGSSGSQSVVGSVMGTPAYMPPEQAMGDIDRMDERSDVFSLGAILAEILTGQPPYTGAGIEVLRQAARGDLDACRARIAACDADEDLKAIALQCLVTAVEARPRDAGEVKSRVGAYLAGLEEKARTAQVEAAEERIRVEEAKRKQRLTLALAASVLLTVVLGGGGWWWAQSREAAREAALREQFQTLVLEAGGAAGPAGTLAATARARDLMGQGGATMPASAVADLQRIEDAARKAQDRARVESENAALLASLEALRGPGADDERFQLDWAETDRQYASAFALYGLTPDAGTTDEAAAALAARGESGALAAALDDWTFARREAAAADGAKRLAAVATRLDGDGTRAELRAGMLSGDVAALTSLAASVNAHATEPQTLYLLAESLRRLAPPATAYAFCAKAHAAHPGDFFLAHSFARASYRYVSPQDALRVYLVARALRPDDYIASVELAQQYINAGEYESAEQFLRDFLRARPRDAVLHAELALVLQRRGCIGASESEFEEAIRLDGEQAWCRKIYAFFLSAQGRSAEALVQSRKVVELSPARADAHMALAWALEGSGDLAEALAERRRAVALAPRDAGPRLDVAHGLWRMQLASDAVALCRTVLAEFPDDLGVRIRAAQLLVRFGAPDEGAEVVRTALASDEAVRRPDASQRARLHLTAAAAHAAMGKSSSSVAALRRALAAAPTDVEVHLEAGSRFQTAGRTEDAIPIFERVLVLEPQHFEGHWALTGSLVTLGRNEEALPHARKAVELNPRHALAAGALAETLLALGKAAEGLPWARRAVELDPRLPPVHFALAQLLAANGESAAALAEIAAAGVPPPPEMLTLSGNLKAKLRRPAEAIEDLQTAVRMNPSHVPAYGPLVDLLLAARRSEEALSLARQGVATAPKDAGSHLVLGTVLARLGRIDEAEVSVERSIALAPSISARLLAAGLPARRGRTEESLQQLRTIVASEPDDASACAELAWALATYPVERRSAEEAVSLARRAVKLSPAGASAGPTVALAAALFRAGRHEEAEREFARTFESDDGGHACVAYLRAMNLHALGNAAEARRWREEADRRLSSEGEFVAHDHRWLRDEAERAFGDR